MMEMKRRNAILAAVIGIAIVAAAAGGILLMNSGSNTANVGSEGSNDIRPTGPAGTVSSVEISSATVNRSNASALADLVAEFNATPERSGTPDFLMKVAVTNNRMDNVTLNASGFVATLDDNSTARALNNMSMTIEPNVTVYPILGFMTNGTEVQSVGYSSGSISFSVERTFQSVNETSDMVTAKAPTGNLTPVEDLNFTDLAAWNISTGGYSPIPLMFSNGSVTLALMTATNNNTTSIGLSATDFWLDVGNGTWVQADNRMNNLPSQLANGTTMPFLLGFRMADNMTVNGSVYYWPEQGEKATEIPLTSADMANETGGLTLKAMWNPNGTAGSNATADGNRTDGSSNGTNTTLQIELMVIGENASASDISDMKVWTLNSGVMNATPVVSADNKSLNVTVNLAEGNDVTLLSYSVGNETKYVWLRSLATQA
jgi:hypothetical protein